MASKREETMEEMADRLHPSAPSVRRRGKVAMVLPTIMGDEKRVVAGRAKTRASNVIEAHNVNHNRGNARAAGRNSNGHTTGGGF